MARNRIFVRLKDGRIQVRLNDLGRTFVRERFQRLVEAQDSSEDPWARSLDQHVDPGHGADDPMWTLQRQRSVATSAELSLITVDEEFLTEAEAWAWLGSLQNALRASALEVGIVDYVSLDEVAPDEIDEIHALQEILFDLAEALG